MPRLLTPARKTALLAAGVLGLLWLLDPARSDRRPPPGVVEISYQGLGGPIAGALDDAVRVFEDESRQRHARDPSQPVYRVVSGQTGTRNPSEDPTRFLLGVAGGAPPDVIYYDRIAVAEWAARGAFLRLDPFLARDRDHHQPDAIRAEDYFPAAWDEVNYHDPAGARSGVYAIPGDIEDRALLYNKDLLRRAGCVDAQGEAAPPRTWEELEAMAARLTTFDHFGHIAQIGFLPAYGTTTPPLYLYGWMNGGSFLSPDGRAATLDNPRVVGALAWLTGLYDRLGGVRNVFGFQFGQEQAALDPFVTNRVAMKIDQFSVIPNDLVTYGQDVDYGVAPLPMPARELAAGRTPANMLTGWGYAIPADARHPEAAWALIRFLSSPRAQLIMAASADSLATSQGHVFVPGQNANIAVNRALYARYVAGNPRLPAKVRAAVDGFNRLLPAATHRPVTPVGQLMYNELIAATQNALYRTLSPAAALARANKNVQKELNRALAPAHGSPVHWRPLFWLYAGLLVAVAIGVVAWETSTLIPRLARRLRLARPSPAGHALPPADGRTHWRERVAGAGFALPWIVGFVVFTGGPIFFSLVISFCSYDILNPARFVGWENYRWLLADDPLFWISLKNTLFMVIGVPLGMVVGLGLALLLNTRVRGIAVWRTLFYLPSIVPAVASSILWIWILNPGTGLLNHWLALFGIGGPNWLQDPRLTKPALILMGLWGAGGSMIVWLAGLNGISRSYYEAAELDGAGPWQKFRHITLPMLTPYIFFNLVMGLIGTFQIFSQAFIMTQGGPVNSTLFFVYHLFNNAFRYLHMGYASAMAWILVLIVLGLTLVQMRLSKRWVHYEGD
ncbi:MAG TPA: extracellular solute-binding protein [Candidatus Baltobacteraceae bacterium]|nr:extracellular solute-binding protein [Candidatus Baltobacteraceae bacterium]